MEVVAVEIVAILVVLLIAAAGEWVGSRNADWKWIRAAASDSVVTVRGQTYRVFRFVDDGRFDETEALLGSTRINELEQRPCSTVGPHSRRAI